MTNDVSRLMMDLNVVVSTLCPDVDMNVLPVRLEEVLCNYNIQRKSDLDLEKDIPEKIELYLASKSLEGLSNRTINGYKSELNLFSRFCQKATSLVTTNDIRAYLSSNKKANMNTIGTKLSVLKSFFGWLVKEEVILRDPTGKVKLPKKPKRLPKGLSIEELETVREACTTLRQRALIEVMYTTGCRLSEIANMDIDDIDQQTMSLRVIGKGNKERIVYISIKAQIHLKKYLKSRDDDCEALFVTERKPNHRMGNRSIQREIDKIEQAAKIKTKLTPHVMRHTFATLSMDAGIELTDLQHLMGHSDPGTTLIYGSVSEERKQQAFKKYHVM
ncbi:site-specific tyrosine recombinase/integron integrase [Bacillus sp. UNC438CL73TsuS30]|uniref:site-specific tyrosine recombinase/integron integrase n=1 Tax=Bacillus sp. UNC438CL73TsuS30 TaxID=1340434 RepID=UPI000AB0E415|nr:site-specific tyrosine recombinase/integron integrase [Bacillus sp. UNC438CL73TsuS30]